MSASAAATWNSLRSKLDSPTIPALDGLRAVAVFLVIFYHFGIPGVNGGLGVEIFFVLSGFLITWLLLKESEKYDSVSLSAFYTRRALRIFPAFYCYWLLVLALSIVRHHDIPWPDTIASFFYVENYYKALYVEAPSNLGHTWSLGIEEQFYLLWPLLFCFFRKNLPKLSTVVALLVGMVWIHRFLLHYAFGVSESYIYNAFDTRLDHLMVGCLLAVLMRRGVLTWLWQAVCTNAYLPLVTLAFLAASSYWSLVGSAAYRNVVGFAIEPLLIAILMVQMIAFSTTGPWSFSQWSVIRYLGRISYPLYLYQELTLFTSKRITASQPYFVQLAFAILVTVLIASASYFLIERPFLKLKDKLQRNPGSKTRKMTVPATIAEA